MFLISHETEDDACQSSDRLLSLGARCINFMVELVTEQELSKNNLSKTIISLENEGFVRIRDTSTQWQKSFVITPTLLGEEALGYYLDKQDLEKK